MLASSPALSRQAGIVEPVLWGALWYEDCAVGSSVTQRSIPITSGRLGWIGGHSMRSAPRLAERTKLPFVDTMQSSRGIR